MGLKQIVAGIQFLTCVLVNTRRAQTGKEIKRNYFRKTSARKDDG